MSTPTPEPIRTAHASAAADIRAIFTQTRLGRCLPAAILAYLPPALREAASKPYALDILNGRKRLIDAVISAVISHHQEAAAAELLAMCRGEVSPAPAGAYPVETGDPLVDLANEPPRQG